MPAEAAGVRPLAGVKSTGSKVNESGTSLLTALLQKRFHSGVS